MLPRPTSASHVSGTGEICTIAEKRPPRCGTDREPISGNPHVCSREDRGTALAETGRRTGVPARRGRKDRVEGEEGRERGKEGREEREGCGEACGREEVVPFATKRSFLRTLVPLPGRGLLASGVGRFSPFFQAWSLLNAMPTLRRDRPGAFHHRS